MKKIIFNQNEIIPLKVFALLVTVIAFYACSHSPFTKAYLSIDQVVDDINKEYIHFEGIGYIKSAKIYKFYSQDKIVDLHVKIKDFPDELLKQGINNNVFNLKQKLSVDLFQTVIQGMEEKHRILFDSIASFKYSVRLNLQATNDTAIGVITLSPQIIKQAIHKEKIVDEHEVPLLVFCKFVNILLPLKDDIGIWKSVSLDQNNIIYTTDVFDKDFPLNEMKKDNDVMQEIRADIINSYKAGQSYYTRNTLFHLYMSDRGIRYVYHGTESNENLIIQLSRQDISDLLDNKI